MFYDADLQIDTKKTRFAIKDYVGTSFVLVKGTSFFCILLFCSNISVTLSIFLVDQKEGKKLEVANIFDV